MFGYVPKQVSCLKGLINFCYSGAGIWSTLGSSGASHGGVGGRGGCGSYLTCRLEKQLPYGDLYAPDEFGSGGALYNGGTGNY